MNYLKFVFISLRHRKTRSLLTVIAVIIGISAVVSLVSLGSGLQSMLTEQFKEMGTDKILITPAGEFYGFGAAEKLTDHDADIIKKVSGVRLVGEIITKVAQVEFKNEIKYTFVIGIPTDESRKIIEEMQGIEIEKGRFFKSTDKYKAGVGYLVSHGKFFEKEVSIGDSIIIQGKKFEVVGTLGRIGNQQDDTQVYIPLDAAKELFGEPKESDMFFVQTEKGFDASLVAEEIKEKMRKDRNLKEGEEDFSIQTFEQMMATFNNIFNIVLIVTIGIAAVSLLVGGIGIMNTMYTSVLERTKDIGVMKAIGATNNNIIMIFLIESGLLGLMGGLIGVGIGVGIAKIVEFIAQTKFELLMLKASITLEIIIGTLAFSFFVGTLAGFLPARRAARLQPVEALRYE